MSIPDVAGLPGLRSARTAEHRRIIKQGLYTYLAGTATIDASLSRDSGNTGYLYVLRPGLLMGKITSSGLWAPSILGVMANAESSAGTSVDVSAAQAVEIVRRVGSTGTLRFVGPPTANGTVATFTETYSAVNTSTGEITVSGLDADLVAGSFVCANDGSQLPRSFVPETVGDWGIDVQDKDGNDVDCQFIPPVAGVIDASQLIFWPSDTSLQAWIKDQLNGTNGGAGSGKFVFDSDY